MFKSVSRLCSSLTHHHERRPGRWLLCAAHGRSLSRMGRRMAQRKALERPQSCARRPLAGLIALGVMFPHSTETSMVSETDKLQVFGEALLARSGNRREALDSKPIRRFAGRCEAGL